MSGQESGAGAAFMEISSRKMQEQDKKIAAIEKTINEVPSNNEVMSDLSANMEGLRSEIQGILLLPEKLEQFSKRLELATTLLQQTPETKVIHHHYVPRLIWITGGLFLGICLACAGWYMTESKLDNFIANDIKYRQMRLDTSQTALQIYLDHLDSLYKFQADMREQVIATEVEYQENFRRLRKAESLKAQAKALEVEARKK